MAVREESIDVLNLTIALTLLHFGEGQMNTQTPLWHYRVCPVEGSACLPSAGSSLHLTDVGGKL